jgi:hypothetical protein
LKPTRNIGREGGSNGRLGIVHIEHSLIEKRTIREVNVLSEAFGEISREALVHSSKNESRSSE